MSYILYINSVQIDLKEAREISLSKQVDDIAVLSTRQTNFSKQLKIKNTAANEKALGYLGVVGNSSNTPYTKNDADLLDAESGEFIIYKGWAVILSRDEEYYTIAIYDGMIDFYKAIDNKKMSDLDLTEINHFRTITTIQDSILNNLPYKYIIADYNGGGTILNEPTINADYLIPAVSIPWLFAKIFETYGFTFSGELFNYDDYKDLWLTYPKGTTVGLDQTTPLLDVTSSSAIYSGGQTLVPIDLNTYLLTAGLIQYTAPNNYEFYICPSEGQIRVSYHTYRFEATYIYNSGQIEQDTFTCPLIVENRNSNTFYTILFNQELYIPVQEGDELYFYASAIFRQNAGGYADYVIGDGNFTLDLYQGEAIDFKEAFDKLLIKDFINEILWLFCLTPFKNRYTTNIHFLTFNERVLTPMASDWSEKFIRLKSEKYIFGAYGKENTLKHKYNASNADYNDAFFSIENENLKDFKTVIQSKFYTPEYLKEITVDDRLVKTYKLWNKEIKDNSAVKYKALDNRFYFIKYTDTVLTNPVTIASSALGASAVFNSLPLERNDGLTFSEIKRKWYSKLGYVLNKTKLLEIQVYLNKNDFQNIDFTEKIYLEQLGGSFLLNKVSNFVPNKPTTVQVLKINQTELIETEFGPGGGTGITTLVHDITLEAEVPTNYDFNITNELYIGVVLGPNEVISQIEFQNYNGGLLTTFGDDIIQGAGVVQFGNVLTLHSLNIDNTYDYTVTPRIFTYNYHVYILNTLTNVLTLAYNVVKNFTINYTEAWGRSLSLNVSNGGQDTQYLNNDFELNAPLRPNEVISHIIPIDFDQEPGPTSEFWAVNIIAMQIGVQANFVDQLVIEPHKVDGTYIPPTGTQYGLTIFYELWAYNTNTMTYRLIYNYCSIQATLTYN
jgi:hypothetical protein